MSETRTPTKRPIHRCPYCGRRVTQNGAGGIYWTQNERKEWIVSHLECARAEAEKS